MHGYCEVVDYLIGAFGVYVCNFFSYLMCGTYRAVGFLATVFHSRGKADAMRRVEVTPLSLYLLVYSSCWSCNQPAFFFLTLYS